MHYQIKVTAKVTNKVENTKTITIMLDIRTEREKARDKRAEEVCSLYLAYQKEYPDAKPHRIFGAISREMDITLIGVKYIIVKAGLYEPKKKRQS